MVLTNFRAIQRAPDKVKMFYWTPREARFSAAFREEYKLDYVKSNQRWWIEIRFTSEADIAVFQKSVNDSVVRLVEFQERFFIEDSRIADSEETSRVFQYAKEALPRLNAAIRLLCPEYIPAEFVCVVELFENGQSKACASSDMFTMRGIDSYHRIVAYLNGPEARLDRILEIPDDDRDVRDALYYAGSRENAWFNLYKTYEIIASRVDGQKGMVGRGWASRNQLERFTRTANHQQATGSFSRHARLPQAAPEDPMTVFEAQALVEELLRRWINEVLQSGSGVRAEEAIQWRRPVIERMTMSFPPGSVIPEKVSIILNRPSGIEPVGVFDVVFPDVGSPYVEFPFLAPPEGEKASLAITGLRGNSAAQAFTVSLA